MADVTRREFFGISASLLASSGLTLKPQQAKAALPADIEFGAVTKVPMRCRMCVHECPVIGHVVDGTLLRIEANPQLPLAAICARGRAAVSTLYSPDRIKTPLIRTGARGEGQFRQASWEEALDIIAEKINELKSNNEIRALAYMPRYCSAQGLDHTLIKALGSANTVNYSDTCWASSNSASLGAFIGGERNGVPHAGNTAVMHDYINAKYAVNLGRNPGGGLAAFSYGANFGKAKMAELRVTTIDPRFPSEAGESDQDWIPIRPGTDQAFLLALINVILSKEYFDRNFLETKTNAAMIVDRITGQPVELVEYKVLEKDKEVVKAEYLVFDQATDQFAYHVDAINPALVGTWEYKGMQVATGLTAIAENVRKYTPEWCETITGITPEQLSRVAENLNAYKPSVYIERGWRSTKYDNGLQERFCANMVNILMGSLGAKGGTIRPLTVKLASGFFKAEKPDHEDTAAYFRKTDPNFAWVTDHNSRRLYAKGVLEDKPYKHKMLIVYGQNPVGGSAGAHQMVQALEKLEMVVAISPFHSDTTMYADVILPECTFMERDEAISSGLKSLFRTVAMHRKAVEPLYESKNGCWIFCQLAKRVLPEEIYTQNWCKWEEKGIEYIWDKQLSEVKGLSAEELTTFKERLLRDGVWSDPQIKYGFTAKTSTGKVEIYSIAMAKIYKNAQEKKPELAERLNPMLTWAPPYWYAQKNRLDPDEFIPISAFAPIVSFSGEQTRNNPLLVNIGKQINWDAVFISRARGAALGLSTGDMIEIFNIERPEMKQHAKVVLSELVHPDAMFFYFGPGAGYYQTKNKFSRFSARYGFNPNHISHNRFAPIDGGHSCQDFIVKIRRA